MVAGPTAIPSPTLHRAQQILKWVVYSLLLVNFWFYILEDWDRAIHTLTDSSTILAWTREFATSIDEAAWFILLAMLELETYVLDNKTLNRWVTRTLHGIRLLCMIMIAHTVFAWAGTVVDYGATRPVENVSSLCQLADEDVSFVYNLNYTQVDADNCQALSGESRFFWLADDPLVTTQAGLELARDLALVDLIEAFSWLLIILLIELVVRLQDRDITGGALMTVANRTKIALYLVLIGLSIYWASLSHWLYVWDEFLWIAGFAAIEMNISDWRDELLEVNENV